MKLLLVRCEALDKLMVPYKAQLVIAPDGYSVKFALSCTILGFARPYVVAEFEVVAVDRFDLARLEKLAYTSYREND